MARIRSLKPEAFASESLAQVDLAAERTFLGLSTQADDEGRHRDNAAIIHGALWCLRAEHTAVDVERDLEQLAAADLVCRYVGCDGRRYLHLRRWRQHQKIDRPSKSRIPPCPTCPDQDLRCASCNADTCTAPRTLGEHSASARGIHPEPSPQPLPSLDAGSRTVDRGSRTVDQPPEAEPPRPDVDQVCQHLADKLEASGAKHQITAKWRDSARLLIDRDERPLDEILAVIDFATADHFWAPNILSVPKLREKYDTLRLKMRPGQQAPGRHQPFRNPENPATAYGGVL